MKNIAYKDIIRQLKETYEKVALEFSQTRQKPWEEMNDLAREVFEGAKVLDIGCGNGRLLYSLPSNIRYLGVDICKGLIEEARKRHPDKRFIVGDFLSLPYNRLGSDYDFIFAIAVFHHLPTKRTRLNFLSKARKLLNKRGKLMLTVWNLWGEDKHKDKIDEDGDIFVPFGKEKAPRYYHAFKIEEMKNLAREARLEIERIKSNRNLVFVLKRYD